MQDPVPAMPVGVTNTAEVANAPAEVASIPAEPEIGDPGGDNDEILDAVVKTATAPSGHAPRENRRRSRNALRKSCKFLSS